MGGLGNQLWQYIAGLALVTIHLREGTRVNLRVDTSWYVRNARATPPRAFLLDKLFPDIATQTDVPDGILDGYAVYREPAPFAFAEDFTGLAPAVILKGYFQHFRYLELARDLFQPRRSPLPGSYRRLQARYALVALHVRRGDYVRPTMPQGLVPTAYYRGALEEVRARIANPYVVIFSDDLDWAETQLAPVLAQLGLPWRAARHAPKDAEIADFSLMTQCRHFICANSSFSMLAALLGADPADSLVYMPYLLNQGGNVPFSKVAPASWQSPSYRFFNGTPSTRPSVSLIITVHETWDYLHRCLESACNQTTSDIEIIVVDAASTPDSWQVIQQFRQHDPRIVAVRHAQSKGFGASATTAIDAARGEWVLFLACENYLRPDAIEILLETSDKHPGTDLVTADGWAILPSFGIALNEYPNYRIGIENPLAHLLRGQLPPIQPCIEAKLWRRDLFIRQRTLFAQGGHVNEVSSVPRLLHHARSATLSGAKLSFFQQGIVPGQVQDPSMESRDLDAALASLLAWGQRNLSADLYKLLPGYCASQRQSIGQHQTTANAAPPRTWRTLTPRLPKPLARAMPAIDRLLERRAGFGGTEGPDTWINRRCHPIRLSFTQKLRLHAILTLRRLSQHT
jgi:hypothetical protein